MPDRLDAYIAAAEAAAAAAAAAIRPLFRARLSADLKADDSPVTIADRNAEQAMRAVLSTRFPTHGILGEEQGLERAAAPLRWVLDPIDGTRAFITGRPTFVTLIALLEDERPILGLIDQPITGERWLGVANRPTTFRGPAGSSVGKAGIRPCPFLAEAELSCTAPEIFTPDETVRWRRLQATTRRTSWGGDGYAYGLIALGGIDVIAEAGLKSWDWAALVPVIEGAGGRITDWTGAPLAASGDGRVLAVGDPALLPQAIQALS